MDFSYLWIHYRNYLFIALGVLVAWLLLRWLLNRPTKEERDHAARFEQLKEKSKDRYRHMRPPQ